MQDAIRLIFASRHFRTATSMEVAANLRACSMSLSSSSSTAVLLNGNWRTKPTSDASLELKR